MSEELFPVDAGPAEVIECLDTVRIKGYDRELSVCGIWGTPDGRVARLSFEGLGGICFTVRIVEELELIKKHERNGGDHHGKQAG